MHQRPDLIYVYDSSLEGLLCCVFESFVAKERPFDIIATENCQPSLLSMKWIATDSAKAARVMRGIEKISADAAYLFKNGFCSCCEKKELLLLDFAVLCFDRGRESANMLADPIVSQLQKAVLNLKRESHQYMEFIRFSTHGTGLVAVIEPKCYVLPTIAPHFCDRLSNELFLIYDKTHRSALIHKPRQWVIVDGVEDFVEPEAEGEEQFYRELWGAYFDSIAIRERTNPQCQRGHLQMRFRSRMTEFLPGSHKRTPGLPTQITPAVFAKAGDCGRISAANGDMLPFFEAAALK